MKKNVSTNAQDGAHNEGQGRNVPTSKKQKSNNSQAMGDMLNESEEQKAGRNKNKSNEDRNKQKGSRGNNR